MSNKRGGLMGIVERIKNALFEVEYVEVDKEDKKVKKKEETEKPIAKRIIQEFLGIFS